MKRLMSAMMPSCREVTNLLTSEGEATWWRSVTVRMHIAMCKHCALFARQIRLLSQALRVSWAPPAAEDVAVLKRRVIERLRAH